MKIRPSVFAEALATSLDAPLGIQKDRIKRFVQILQKRRMRKLLPLILRSLENRLAKDIVFVESATTLPPEYYAENGARLRMVIHAPDHTHIQPIVEPTHYGGIKITYNDYEYDTTIRRQLEIMEEKLWHQ